MMSRSCWWAARNLSLRLLALKFLPVSLQSRVQNGGNAVGSGSQQRLIILPIIWLFVGRPRAAR